MHLNSLNSFDYSLLILLLALGMVFSANNWFFRFWALFYVMVFTSLSPQLSLGLIFIPHVMASPQSGPFPSVAFKDFSNFILGHFGPAISLPTVIMLLLSMTNNTELLSLHFKQDRRGGTTSWIRCLLWAINAAFALSNASFIWSLNSLTPSRCERRCPGLNPIRGIRPVS